MFSLKASDMQDIGGVPPILSDSFHFEEPLAARLRRWMLGLAYPLRLKRIAILPRVLARTLDHVVLGKGASPMASAECVLHGSQGFAGVSDDLSVDALLSAYRKGFFPFCHLGPMKWWNPETRAVLTPKETHVPKKVRQLLRNGKFSVTFDRDFASVIRACAQVRPGKTPLTWITSRVMSAYHDLHLAGFAHSVEVWDSEKRLVGGLYGVALGEVFFGESQFSNADHASKVGVAVLHEHLAHWGFKLRDAKFMTGHLQSLGFREMPRAEFLAELKAHAHKPDRRGRWQIEEAVVSEMAPRQPNRQTPQQDPQKAA